MRRESLENRRKFEDINATVGPLSSPYHWIEQGTKREKTTENATENEASEIRQICSKYLSFN